MNLIMILQAFNKFLQWSIEQVNLLASLNSTDIDNNINSDFNTAKTMMTAEVNNYTITSASDKMDSTVNDSESNAIYEMTKTTKINDISEYYRENETKLKINDFTSMISDAKMRLTSNGSDTFEVKKTQLKILQSTTNTTLNIDLEVTNMTGDNSISNENTSTKKNHKSNAELPIKFSAFDEANLKGLDEQIIIQPVVTLSSSLRMTKPMKVIANSILLTQERIKDDNKEDNTKSENERDDSEVKDNLEGIKVRDEQDELEAVNYLKESVIETELAAVNSEESEIVDDNYDYANIPLTFPFQVFTTTTSTTVTSTIASTLILKSTQRAHAHRHLHKHLTYDGQSPIIVTAMFDIGRGKWPKYTRTYEQYMNYLTYLLRLKNRIVIFTDSRGADYVRKLRSNYNTQIFEMSIRDLPLYRYREEMKDIIRHEQANWQFDPKTRFQPEANSADYNILVNSKPYFLYNATQSSRFRISDSVFAWIDAGYGIIPSNCHWRPDLRRDRITIIKLTPAHDKIYRYSISSLYRVDWVVLSGGFLAGDSLTINRFYRFYHKTFMDLLDSGRIDDDQTVLTLMVKDFASLFSTVHSNGDWFALFRLFPCK
ncbi:unnamed protein product [Thelazia callipaeda]|uniref:FCP1 homology domain-containing protein n=1 Tax=Thelazia callipaeda TaxID=103827 RepID=A0A0N5CZN5_THECL|nr:unnamed protein product [Thelazia callipaeda]